MRHWAKALVGLAITVFLLWWVLKDVDPAEIWAHIRSGNLWLLAAGVFIATADFSVRAMRWKILLARILPDSSFRSRFAGVSIGFMANNLLPARAGEFARAYAFSRLEPLSAGAAFGSLVIERILDGIVLLLLLVFPVFTPGFPQTGTLSSGVGGVMLKAGVAGIVAVLGAVVAMVVWPTGFARVGRSAARFLPRSVERRVVDALDAFIGALDIMRAPGLVALAFAWSVGFWVLHATAYWLAMLAFGIDTGFVSAVFTEAVTGFASGIPSAPGFIGTFHAGAAFALTTVYGVDAAQSRAFAFAFHFGGFVPITAIGLWFAWKLGLSLGDVGASEERVEEVIEAEHGGPPGEAPGP